MSRRDLQDALRAAADRGQRPTFWLRDDDATVPSEALDSLLAMTNRHGVPVTLAVIPARSGQALADRLAGEPLVNVAVHGWAHLNHAGSEEKKQELGIHRPLPQVLGQLARGLAHLRRLHGRQSASMLVPPWNRIHPDVVQGLSGIGYTALSVFGREKPAPIQMLNTHVDLIDWRGDGRAKDLDTILAEIAIALHRDVPVGFLTHHLIHDSAAWNVLDRVLALTTDPSESTWAALPTLLTPRQ